MRELRNFEMAELKNAAIFQKPIRQKFIEHVTVYSLILNGEPFIKAQRTEYNLKGTARQKERKRSDQKLIKQNFNLSEDRCCK